MIHAGFNTAETTPRSDPSRGMALVALSVATSIDALAIGLTLAVMHVDIWYPSVIIGVVTGVLSVLGVQLGKRLSARFGQRMEILGGVALILVGLHLVWTHLRAL